MATAAAHRPEAATHPLRVLVMDDGRDTTASAAELIGQWGYDVRRADIETGALEVAAACRPDVLLVDFGTRDVRVCRIARRARRLPGLDRALMIAVTGSSEMGRRRLVAAAGFDFCVPKPMDPATLETLLLSRQVELSADSTYATPGRHRSAGARRATREGPFMTRSDRPRPPATPADDILGVDDDDGARRSLAAGLTPDGAAVSPAADGPAAAPPVAGEPGAHKGEDLRQFGTPDVLRKPFTVAETGRKRRKETREREEEEVARDDQWRDDGGQGHRPVP